MLDEQARAADPLAKKPGHLPAKAGACIFLMMEGGPSHIDTFDPKPKLAEMNGKPLPIAKPQFEFAPTGNLLASPWKSKKHGRCGTEISELFPLLATHADELCVIRSMNGGNEVSHGPALLRMNTGDGVFNRPSMGAWTLYGLGTENRDLPGFVSLSPSLYHGGAQNYGSAFLPALARDNVELVTDAIVSIAPEGPVTAAGRTVEVDTIIYATGFDAQRLVREVPFLEPDKAARATELWQRVFSGNDGADMIPGLDPRALYELLPKGRSGRSGKGSGFAKQFRFLCDPRTRHVSRRTLELVADVDAAVERGAAPAVEVVEIASEGDAEPIPTAIDAQAGGDDVDAVADAAEAEVETAEESIGESHPEASESLLHSREDGNPGEKPLDGEEGEEPGSVPA